MFACNTSNLRITNYEYVSSQTGHTQSLARPAHASPFFASVLCLTLTGKTDSELDSAHTLLTTTNLGFELNCHKENGALNVYVELGRTLEIDQIAAITKTLGCTGANVTSSLVANLGERPGWLPRFTIDVTGHCPEVRHKLGLYLNEQMIDALPQLNSTLARDHAFWGCSSYPLASYNVLSRTHNSFDLTPPITIIDCSSADTTKQEAIAEKRAKAGVNAIASTLGIEVGISRHR